MRFHSADEVHAAWEARQISRLDYVTNMRPFLRPTTIDAITAKMPASVLETFERFAQSYESSGRLSVGRGPELGDPPDLESTLRQWREKRRVIGRTLRATVFLPVTASLTAAPVPSEERRWPVEPASLWVEP